MRFTAILTSLLITAALPCVAAENDWSKVATALGKSGAVMLGDVYRVGMPRTDLHVMLDGVELKPTLALGSWVGSVNARATLLVRLRGVRV